jgi:hypothetical protein
LATYFVLGAQAIMARSFGWSGLWAGLLTELAIEPLPFGEHSLIHIDWNATNPAAPDGILHSWTYSHPLAVEHIKMWVFSTLAVEAHSSSLPEEVRFQASPGG